MPANQKKTLLVLWQGWTKEALFNHPCCNSATKVESFSLALDLDLPLFSISPVPGILWPIRAGSCSDQQLLSSLLPLPFSNFSVLCGALLSFMNNYVSSPPESSFHIVMQPGGLSKLKGCIYRTYTLLRNRDFKIIKAIVKELVRAHSPYMHG